MFSDNKIVCNVWNNEFKRRKMMDFEKLDFFILLINNVKGYSI